MNFGDNLKKIRKYNKMSQEDFNSLDKDIIMKVVKYS